MSGAKVDRTTYKPTRMLAFSDAVMAVAITLLVLNLTLPEGTTDAALGSALRASLHGIGVYILSFVVIGLLWMGHHQQFDHISHVDGPLIWLNLFFLMTIGLLPFVTSILGDHSNALGVSLYAGVLVTTSLISAAIGWYASRDPQLMDPEVPTTVRRQGIISPLFIAVVFALSIVVAQVSPDAAQYTWLLLFFAHPAARLFNNWARA